MKVVLLVNTAAAEKMAKNLRFFKVTICDLERANLVVIMLGKNHVYKIVTHNVAYRL